uniref:S41 family peptidase n=1 Tax=Paramuribaculum intestinale TaxID=2094151 RepID=UPI0025B6E6A0
KRKSDKLFIDLRNNGGGLTPIVYAMLYQLYGSKVATQDYSQQFYRKLSPLYFKKINSSLEDFNKQYNCDFTYNDYTIWGKNSEPKKELSPEELEKYLSGLMTSRTDMLVRQKGEPLYRPAEVYVITDGVTFSAAYHTAHYLRQLGAKVIGVASSQAPNTFMETTPFRLTHTGLTGSISNSIQNMLPADHPEARQMKPDVELTTATFHRYGDDDNA